MRREHSMFGLLVMLAPVAQAQPVDGAPAGAGRTAFYRLRSLTRSSPT